MMTQDAEADLCFNCIKRRDRGLVYYCPLEQKIFHLTTDGKLYAKYDCYWKIFSDNRNKPRRIKDKTELKEYMNKLGYEYLGEL